MIRIKISRLSLWTCSSGSDREDISSRLSIRLMTEPRHWTEEICSLLNQNKSSHRNLTLSLDTVKKLSRSNTSLTKTGELLRVTGSSLRGVFREPPGISFRRAPTIKDKLVRSHLPASKPNTWLRRQKGNFCCGHCNYCTNMVKTDTFKDVFSNKTYPITSFINCNTTHVVYRLECTCGLTKRRLRDRVAEHRYAIRSANMKYPMAKHFIEAQHGSDATLKVSGIEVISSDTRGGDKIKRLKQREAYWIYALKATYSITRV